MLNIIRIDCAVLASFFAPFRLNVLGIFLTFIKTDFTNRTAKIRKIFQRGYFWGILFCRFQWISFYITLHCFTIRTIYICVINSIFCAKTIGFLKNKKAPQKGTFVRLKGLEPPRLSAPDPKSGTATNYATTANGTAKIQKKFEPHKYSTKLKFNFFLYLCKNLNPKTHGNFCQKRAKWRFCI